MAGPEAPSPKGREEEEKNHSCQRTVSGPNLTFWAPCSPHCLRLPVVGLTGFLPLPPPAKKPGRHDEAFPSPLFVFLFPRSLLLLRRHFLPANGPTTFFRPIFSSPPFFFVFSLLLRTSLSFLGP